MGEEMNRTSRQALRSWARRLPKIDLHRHLEGSLRLTTLAELAQVQGMALPCHDLEALRPFVQMTEGRVGFRQFLAKFEILRRFFVSKEVVQRITREAIADAAEDNVLYLELRFNPLALAHERQFDFSEVTEWVVEATAEAQATYGLRTCLILQVPRNESLRVANDIVDIAIATRGRYVRGIDLAGDERTYPPERFVEPFARAAKAGLQITVHAGEAAGADSVRAALLYLHPQRIGHGIRAIENSQVVEMLNARRVTLEVCPSSNVHTGVVPSLAHHPLVDLLSLQLPITVNTDDPGVCATTLTEEIVSTVEDVGVAPEMIYRMLRYAVEGTFMPVDEKANLRTRFRAALTAFPDAEQAFERTSTADPCAADA